MAAFIAFFGLFILVPLFFFVVGILGTIFWIYMLVHAATNEIKDKVMWIIIIIFTHFIGAAIYYYVVKKPYDLAHPKGTTVPPADATKTA